MSGDMSEAASHSPASSETLYLFNAHVELISQNLIGVLSKLRPCPLGCACKQVPM